MSKKSNESLLPTETLELDSGLSLVPRIKFLLTVTRSDSSVKPIDEWQLKRSLIDFLNTSFSVTVPEDDLHIRKFKDLKKRKREDPVARGSLFVRDLEFLDKIKAGFGKDDGDLKEVEKKLSDWKKSVVSKMDGIELNLSGVKFKLSVAVPESDDFYGMKKAWEERIAFGDGGYSRGLKGQPDTIILRGVPSRWFAETRVSSKPSMLVTHTIFSALGKIRNLDVAEDDNIGEDAEEDDGDLVSGLQCKIVVRFEDYKEFCTALKVLCCRSLQKQGSRLRADYEVTWDKDGVFRNGRNQTEENNRWTPKTSTGSRANEASRDQSYSSHVSGYRSKRFKE